jgi:hypothetical protein
MSTSRAPTAWVDGSERVALRRLVWVGPLAVAAATLADEAARRLLVAVVPGITPGFVALEAGAVALMTVLFTTAAVAVFAAVAKLSIQPIRTYQIVAAVALVLSLFPDLMLLNEPSATVGGVVSLMVLHAVAAAAVVWPLCSLTVPTCCSR